MACEFVPVPGGVAIVCGPRRKCSVCKRRRVAREGDWKVPSRKSGTCDKGLCTVCTRSPAPDKDLCPKHWEEWQARLAAKRG